MVRTKGSPPPQQGALSALCLCLNGPDRSAVRTCADVKKTRQWIREKIRTTDEFQELLKKTLTDASAVEQWVENVLCEKDGPKKVLDVVYTEGPALDFLKFMTRIAGKSSKGERTVSAWRLYALCCQRLSASVCTTLFSCAHGLKRCQCPCRATGGVYQREDPAPAGPSRRQPRRALLPRHTLE
jgi:hypothetical protein